MEDRLKKLEETCIHNVEDAFANYLANDVRETGGVVDLFNKQDVYLFWLESAWEINRIIGYIVSDDSLDFLIKRAVLLKRLIDENLIKFGPSEADIRKDLNFAEEEHSQELIGLNINDGKADEFVKVFHKILINEGLTNSQFEIIASNFIKGDRVVTPINWTGKLNDLAGLIIFLTDHGIFKLPKNKTKASLIKQHFLIDNKEINSGSLRVTLSYANIDDHPELQELIAFKVG